jgi:hypothetical protein
MEANSNGHVVCKIGDPDGSCISLCMINGRMEFAIFDEDGNMLRERIKNSDDCMTMSDPVPDTPRRFAMCILDMLDRAVYKEDEVL